MEAPEPIIFNAVLDSVTLKSRGVGKQPEISMKLQATIKPSDMPHIQKLQELYMQVAFAPAQAMMPLEPPAA